MNWNYLLNCNATFALGRIDSLRGLIMIHQSAHHPESLSSYRDFYLQLAADNSATIKQITRLYEIRNLKLEIRMDSVKIVIPDIL